MKTPFPANVCDGGCKRLRWRMQTFAMADANVCDGGCKRLREKMQCFASEMGKTGTEVASPILDDYHLLNFLEHTKRLRADSFCRNLPYIIIMA